MFLILPWIVESMPFVFFTRKAVLYCAKCEVLTAVLVKI